MVHFSECSTIAANCNNETQIGMRDWTVEHFPADAAVVADHGPLHALPVHAPELAHVAAVGVA